jgi:hypothetical protein
VDWLLSGIETMPLAQYLRTSRWGYAAVGTAHVLGIALVVGSIMPLNLRLLGFWPNVPLASLARLLVPVAAAGLVLAVAAGALLFSVRAGEYAALTMFKVKLALVGLGILAALDLHRAYGMRIEAASPARQAGHAIVSMTCWLGALICGRLIAFVAD